MSLGTYLIGSAIFLLVAAYVGKPLRRTKFEAEKVIEQWVADARTRLKKVPQESAAESAPESVNRTDLLDVEAVNFCPQCGRRVETDHRFCPGCGAPLQQGAVK